MLRQCLISSSQAYGAGTYGSGYYGGFSEVKIMQNWGWEISINQQRDFSFTIVDNPDDIEIVKGLQVVFLIDGVISFKGIVFDCARYEALPGLLYYDVVCETFDCLAQKRRIGAVFENKTAGYIVKYIINNYLSEENISEGVIHDGLTFDKVIFNYRSCHEALNKLQVSCPGYYWNIDFNRQLHFVQRTTNTCSQKIDSNFIHRLFKPYDTLNEYRNIQYIEGGQKETNIQQDYTPTPAPDGKSREFTVQFPIGLKPIVETNVNGAGWSVQDVGINGIDTGKEFYWTYGSNQVTQDSSETVLTNSNPTPDEIRISYVGLVDVRLRYKDNAEIQARADIEGNSGKYEEVFQNKDIISNYSAVQFAKGLINKFKDPGTAQLIVEDDIADLEAGKLVKVEKSLFGIDDYYLIKSIKASQQTPEHVTYSINLLKGEDIGNWEDYFKKLLDFQSDILETDTLTTFQGIDESWYASGSVTAEVCEALYPNIDVFPSATLFPGKKVLRTEVLND